MKRDADRLDLAGGIVPKRLGPRVVELRQGQRQVVDRLAKRLRVDRKPRGIDQMPPEEMPVDQKDVRRRADRLSRKETGLPIVTEIMDVNHLPLFEDVDVIQVGARNMQNFELLKELGQIRKPILLKRGLANTIQEWLMSAEYIMAGGNDQVILCERGIRTFETATRNTLDLAAVPVLHKLTHLPVVVDPSHATGYAHLVKPMAVAAAAAGADGLMIEVHNDPPHALSDGAQSLTPAAFDDVAKTVFAVRPFACR